MKFLKICPEAFQVVLPSVIFWGQPNMPWGV